MTSIIISPDYIPSAEFKLSELGKEPFLFGLGGKPADLIKPYTPYCIGKPSTQASAIIANLSDVNTSRCIADACKVTGVDNLLGLAEMYSGLHTAGLSTASASFGAGSDAYKAFTGQLTKLESLLFEMQKAKVSGDAAKYQSLRKQAESLHSTVNKRFAGEVNKVTANIKSRKGVPLKDFARVENIVKSSRNLNKLNFLDLAQASTLNTFAKASHIAGNSFLVFDFGLGASKTYVEYQKGGNWHKTMFVESMKLGGAAAIAYGAGTAAASLALTLTPVGWIVLVGVAATLSYTYVTTVDAQGGRWYDEIMGWFN